MGQKESLIKGVITVKARRNPLSVGSIAALGGRKRCQFERKGQSASKGGLSLTTPLARVQASPRVARTPRTSTLRHPRPSSASDVHHGVLQSEVGQPQRGDHVKGSGPLHEHQRREGPPGRDEIQPRTQRDYQDARGRRRR